MLDIIVNQQCYKSPTMDWTIQYEHKRTGADMYYRFYWKVRVRYSTSYYDYGVALKLYLDGVAYSVTVKGETSKDYQWSKEGTTDWYKVTGKTSGTTSFYAQLYDTSRSEVMATSSTFNLVTDAAASVIGHIPDFVIGDSITIPITKYNTAYTDSLVIHCEGLSISTHYTAKVGIANGDVISFSSSDLLSFYSCLRSQKSGLFTFTLETKNGDTVIGTSSTTATGTITNADPIFTEDQIEYYDVNDSVVDITGNNQHIVQNKSSLTVKIGSAKGNKGADISYYTVTVNGVRKLVYEGGEITFGEVNTSQNTKITVSVTDTRGNRTQVTKDVTVLAYSAPVLNVSLGRLNNYEDETHLTVDTVISSVNSKNAIESLTYQKMQSGGDYGAVVELTNKVKHTTSCDKDYSYTFSITVRDKFESVTREFVLPKGKFPLFIDTEKNAVGVNEFPQTGEALRVAGGVACFDDGIVLKSGAKSFKITINGSGTLVITELS